MQLSSTNTEDKNDNNKNNDNNNNNLRYIRFERTFANPRCFKSYSQIFKVIVDFSSFSQDLYIPLALFRSPYITVTPRETKQWNPTKNLFICVNKDFTQTFIKKSKEEKKKIICTYEYKKVHKRENHITITKSDMSRLYPNVCLNDKIVNFYLKFLEDYFIPSNNKIYITNTYWYPLHFKKINNLDQIKSTGNNKFTIFNYDILITPILENHHWTLVIINNLAKMRNVLEYDNYEPLEETIEIFYLDSLDPINEKSFNIVKTIKKILLVEYYKCVDMSKNSDSDLQSKLKLIKSYAPKLPKQENNIDCGIFMLYFCEKFLSDVEFFFSNAKQEFVDSNVNDNDSLLKWFDVNEIKQKRNNIMNLLVNIGTDNKDSSIVIENYIKSLNNKT